MKQLSEVKSSVTRGEPPKIVGVAGRKPGGSRGVVYSVQLSSAPAVSPVQSQTPLPRAAYLSSHPTSLLPEPTYTTVVMEAIANHADEEVRRAVTFSLNLWSMRHLVTPDHGVSSDKLTYL